MEIYQDDPDLASVQYLVFDEVHERGVDSDFCLALILSALNRRLDLKLIVMSATISTSKFSIYLGKSLHCKGSSSRSRCSDSEIDSIQEGGVPVLSIPGYTFPVEEYFKSDYERAVNSIGRSKADDTDHETDYSKYNRRVDDLDYGLIANLIVCLVWGGSIDLGSMLERAEGAVLVFMPGVQEILKLIQILSRKLGGTQTNTNGRQIRIMPLHGGLSPSEQKKVFQPAGPNELKIVISTNVAEVIWLGIRALTHTLT